MKEVEIILPKMGESIEEATIIRWLKKEGEAIEEEESIVEIATDKVDTEVPSSASGILAKIMVKEGEVAKVGQVICTITTKDNVVSQEITSQKIESYNNPSLKEELLPSPVIVDTSAKIERISTDKRFYSPLVKAIAQKENINNDEIANIKGTGDNGRVTKSDILTYIENRKEETIIASQPISSTINNQLEVSELNPKSDIHTSINLDGHQIIPMDRMRKLIAEHMVMSKQTSAHVTTVVEADVTTMVLWRNKIKQDFERKEGEKITFTPLFIEAVSKAIKEFPMINVSVEGTNIIVKKSINIGMATALPTGNLIVPVIKNADRMSLLGLTKSVNDLANRARSNKLIPDEIQNGTFTITNIGTHGSIIGTPIINQPQVAILATGKIQKQPTVIETPLGDTIGIRYKMLLSLSYDHRVVDGALGGSFVSKVANYLETFDINRNI